MTSISSRPHHRGKINATQNHKRVCNFSLEENESLAFVLQQLLRTLLLLLLLLNNLWLTQELLLFGPRRSSRRRRDDVEILVDVQELVGTLAIHVVVPLADSPLLRVDCTVRAEEGFHDHFITAVVPHLWPKRRQTQSVRLGGCESNDKCHRQILFRLPGIALPYRRSSPGSFHCKWIPF